MCVLCGQLYLIICYLFKQATNYDVILPGGFLGWGLQRVFFNLLMTAGWMPLRETDWEHGGLRNHCGISWCLKRSRLFLVKMLGECFLEVLHCLGIHNECFVNTCFRYESWLQEKLSMRLREWEQTEIMVCAPSCIPGSWCSLIFKCFITIFDDLLLWKSIWEFAQSIGN